MKKNIALAFLTPFFVAPVLILAQEETKAPAAEAPAAEATAEATEAAPAATEASSSVVADAAEATAEVVADTAAAVVDTAGSLVEGAASVFERATTRDAWDIRLSVFAQYGDNRDSVPDHYDADVDERYRYKKEDDICFGIQPSAAFTGSFADNQHYKLGYSPIYQYWTNPRVGSKRNELSHAALAEYRYVHDTRNEFSIRDSFKYIQNDYWYLHSDDVEQHNYLNKRRTEHEQAHYDNTLGGLWKTLLGEHTALSLNGYWNTIRYDDDEVAATEDEDKYVAIAKLMQALNGRFSYGVFAKYECWDESGKAWDRNSTTVDKVPRGIDTYTIGLAATYRASARFSIDAKYGWEWVKYEADSIDDRDFPGDGDISATYAFSLRTKGTFGFRYGVTEAWVYPFASQDLYSFYTTFQTRHTKRLFSTIRLEYKIAEYDLKYVPVEARSEAFMDSHDGDKKDLYAEFGVNYRWNQNLDFSVTYSYEDVDSDVSTSYSENTVILRATYLF